MFFRILYYHIALLLCDKYLGREVGKTELLKNIQVILLYDKLTKMGETDAITCVLN